MLSWKVALFQKKGWERRYVLQNAETIEKLRKIFFDKTQQYSSLLIQKRY